MKKGSKQKKVSSKKLSMKEALSGVKGSESKRVSNGNGRVDIRDYWWKYPSFLTTLFKRSIPFSYVLFFLVVGMFLVSFLQSDVVARILDDSGTGDTFTEGSVGAISTFNPLFVSVNYVDKTVQELVFDRFVYIDSEDNPIPGVAKEWEASEDNLSYEFKIRDDIYWQDGTELTVDDVVFTFNTARSLAEDYGFDSVGISLIGVDIEKKGENRVVFELQEPNPTFFEAVSLFVVPESRLGQERLDELPFNMFARYPLGSGRYKVTRTEQNTVFLTQNEYDNHDSDIKNIVFKVFPDQESLEMSFRIGALDAVGGWDYELLNFTQEYSNLQEFRKVEEYRTKLMFFNTRRENYKERDVRVGLSYIIDREVLMEESNLKGEVRLGPFAQDSWAFSSEAQYYEYDPERAAEFFKNIGFEKNDESGFFESDDEEILSFTISFFDSITNKRLIETLEEMLREEGIVLKSEKLSYNQITQEIIATRDFDILLYEVETTVDPDQYNLWHSLKSSYPDLNISGYSYERVDILLEDARSSLDKEERKEKYTLFQRYLMDDAPAVFLYNPTFFYYVKDNVKGIDLDNINFSYQRFNNIQDWTLR